MSDAPRHQPRRVHFTARSIAKLAPEAHAVDWFDADTRGLSLRVMPSGARTWYFFYRHGKVSRRVKIGTWPAVELAKARTIARGHRMRVETEGADPAHERQEARTLFTVEDLGKLYLELHAKATKRTWKDDQWRFNRYILSAWKTRGVNEITRADAHALLDKIASDGKHVQANRVQALISKLWNFAIDRKHADGNIVHRMGKRANERALARTRVLSDAELRALWQALDAVPGDAADALRLRLLTGQRGAEVHTMAWADVDLESGVWTIPAARAKNGIEHRVPLTSPAIVVLDLQSEQRRVGEARVFPGLYHQRKDLRARAAIHGGVYRWHDLRRTVATRLAELGTSDETIGRVLNHAKRGVTAVHYNQHAYDGEKRQALEAWARELDRIVMARPRDGRVVPLRRP